MDKRIYGLDLTSEETKQNEMEALERFGITEEYLNEIDIETEEQ